ncbi:hypothetical protein ABZ721_37230 [Streptomyces sp. NPDC006733]
MSLTSLTAETLDAVAKVDRIALLVVKAKRSKACSGFAPVFEAASADRV